MVRPWTALANRGRPLIDPILEAINDSAVFLCDLTYPNANVLFELGYAIGRKKRLWLSIDPSIADTGLLRSYITTSLLPDIGYFTYSNSEQLTHGLLKDKPWQTPLQHPLGPGFIERSNKPEASSLFYMKQPYDNEASRSLTETLSASPFSENMLIDDPRDNPSATLFWYAEKLRDSDASVIHLLSTDHVDYLRHNLKCSLVAGMARGMSHPLLMIAPEPYVSPIDYRSILKLHKDSKSCRTASENWLTDISKTLPKRRPRRIDSPSLDTQKFNLRDISLGEPIAEHEHNRLDEYFIPTPAYYRILDSQQTVLVGRRGTGKTATFYALQSTLTREKRNHVCMIKPVGYEIDGLVRVLEQQIHRAERGYLIESLWKFLIYGDLASSVAESLRRLPAYQVGQLNAAEKQLLEFVDEHTGVLAVPFSARLDRAVNGLTELSGLKSAEEQQAKISEELHGGIIRELRQLLGKVLSEHRRVDILIDNLDEPWGPGAPIEHLAGLLLGLLRLSTDIIEDFHHSDNWRRSVNVGIHIFLRSDIFFIIQSYAHEQDKIPWERISWQEPESLLRVIDERLETAGRSGITAKYVWEKLFPERIEASQLRDFMFENILPRPRDFIYFVKAALASAINRGRDSVEEHDINVAKRKYSEFAFWALMPEDDPRKGQLEEILFHFARSPVTVRRSEIESRMEEAGVATEDFEYYIDLLCDLNFLCIETRDGFRMVSDEGERKLLRRIARQAAQAQQTEEQYRISTAFHDVLQVT